jgi:ankyrin repeat protein
MSAVDDELLQAAGAINLTAVQAALEKGADVNARDASGRTALMTASMDNAIPIVQVLLQAGAGVNLQAAMGETALILAASGRGEAIEVLLANGADPNIGDRDGKRPLMWLVDLQFHEQFDTSASIAPLVQAGARINDRDAKERTVLMWAVTGIGNRFNLRPAVLAQLVANGADVNATDPSGETAMFNLVRFIDNALALDLGPPCIQVLVDAGADRNPVNRAGKTPLGVVRPFNHLVIDRLRHLGFT